MKLSGNSKLRDEELVKWKPDLEDVISRNIQGYMEILELGDDDKVRTSKGFKLDAYLKILADCIELKEINTPEDKRNLLYRAGFIRLKKYKKQDILSFRRALAAEVRRYLNIQTEEYWILYPLHVASGELSTYRSISIIGKKILIKRWENIRKEFSLDEFLDEIRILHSNLRVSLETNFTPLIMHTSGRTLNEAFDEAERAFDMFRWLLNLTMNFGRYYRQFGGMPKPLADYLSPPFYGIFRANGDYEKHYYNFVTYPKYKENEIKLAQIQNARELAAKNLIKPDKKDTSFLVLRSIEKYGEALDATDYRLAFLEFWQILELLTLQTDQNFNMRQVTSRTRNLLGEDLFAEDLLGTLYNTRNKLVHEGYFPHRIGLEEVGLLKFIVERCINRVFSLQKDFPSVNNLRTYYTYASKGKTDLEEAKRIIARIQKRRKA